MPQKPITEEQRQKALNYLKGLRPPDAYSLSDEERLKAFRKLMEPPRKKMSVDLKDETGKVTSEELELPPDPYPFKNPNAMTNDLANAVRDVRKYAPGAGTAQHSNLTNVPPIGYIGSRANLGIRSGIETGLFDPTETTLLGMAPERGNKDYGDNVYINPNSERYGYPTGSVVAHELSHRNIPSTPDDPQGGFSFDPSAQYVQDLYNAIKDNENKKKVVVTPYNKKR